MPSYMKTFRNTSRDEFAREAVRLEFRARDAKALDQADFRDRHPNRGPRRVGEVASEVVNDIGRKAFGHWLAQVDKAENDDTRAAALEVVAEITRVMGLELADVTGRRAAT